MAKPKRTGQAGATLGFRSGLEDLNAAHLREFGQPVQYEEFKLKYTKDPSTYTPDFILQNGIVIETKGHFVSADRKKHTLIKAQHPDLDIRFVFSNPKNFLVGQKVKEFRTWLKRVHDLTVPMKIPADIKAKYQPEFFSTLKTKPSQTTYADWCDKKGFLYATETIPLAWIKEPKTAQRLIANEAAMGWKPST